MRRTGALGGWTLLVGSLVVLSQSGCSSSNDTSLFGNGGSASGAAGSNTPQGGASAGNGSAGAISSGAGTSSTGGVGAGGGAGGGSGTSGTSGTSGHAGASGSGGGAGGGAAGGGAAGGGPSNGGGGSSGAGGTSGAGGISGAAGSGAMGGAAGFGGTSGAGGTSGTGGVSGAGGTSGAGGVSGAGGTSGAGSLLISQIQTRSTGGGTDEFIEIYNPTDAPVTFDATWALTARADATLAGCTSNLGAHRFTGGGQSIHAHGYLLYTGALYGGAALSDGAISAGIADGGSVVLTHGSVVSDAVCYYFNAESLAGITDCSTAYVCEGTPVLNPHDNTANTNTNVSLERKPGGVAGNRVDTNDNASDFQVQMPAEPRGSMSGPSN